MPYIYKYVNSETNDVEYVGIIKNDANFPKRFDQHKRDSWWKPFKYNIYFAEVQSITDAEALEGHFISEYGSSEFHNIAKARWGTCSFAPKVEWTEYAPEKDKDLKRGYIKWNHEDINSRLWSAEEHLLSIENELKRLRMEIYEEQKTTEKRKRASVRHWFRSNFALVYYPMKGKYATSEMLFESYCDFAENEDDADLYDFEDLNEFWDTMFEIQEYRNAIRNGNMYSILTKEEYEKMHIENMGKVVEKIDRLISEQNNIEEA